MRYCTRTDVETEYGAGNVLLWADLDGDGSSTKIANRIEAAITLVEEQIDNRLRGGPYAVPLLFTSYEITNIAAVLAGAELYAKRGVEDAPDGRDRLESRRETARARLSAIRAGLVRLDPTLHSVSYPQVETDDEDDE